MPLSELTLSDDLRAALEQVLVLASDRTDSLAAYERQVFQTVMAVGRALVTQALRALSPTEAFVEDGVVWKPVVHASHWVVTLFGPVRVARPRFRRQRRGPTRCLIQERAGLVCGGWTEPAAKIAALALTEMPFERAEAFFAEQGTVTASCASLRRFVGDWSDRWEADRCGNEQAVREATPIPAEACAVAVSLDGVMVRLVDADAQQIKAAARARGVADKGPAGLFEASVGVLAFYDAEGKRLETRRYARMPEEGKETTKAWLRRELMFLRQQRPDLVSVAMADGAASLWPFLESLGTDYQLVDFYHTAEHLHRHVSKANGASSLETQALLRQMRHALLTESGAAARVFADMQQLRQKAGTQAVSTEKTSGKRQPTFFDRHHHRMAFADLRALHLPIGTGVTESTCKLTVCDRLRRTGMRWTRRGGQGVLTLRTLLVSDQFEAGWNQFVKISAEMPRLAA